MGHWPASDPSRAATPSPSFIRTSDSNRHLTTDLRDQHVVAGIGRGWGDDILHRARLSPFVSLRSLSPAQREDLLAAVDDVLGEALELERGRRRGAVGGQAGRPLRRARTLRRALPDAGLRRHLARVSFESYEMTYCPTCQTGGKVLADRRLSRLLEVAGGGHPASYIELAHDGDDLAEDRHLVGPSKTMGS